MSPLISATVNTGAEAGSGCPAWAATAWVKLADLRADDRVPARASRHAADETNRGAGRSNSQGLDDVGYHGADCTIVAAPGRPIEGVVRDADTRAPIPGAVVTAMPAGSLLSIEGLIAATTDATVDIASSGSPRRADTD